MKTRHSTAQKLFQYLTGNEDSAIIKCTARLLARWSTFPYSGLIVTIAGTSLISLLIFTIDYFLIEIPNPGLFYLLLIALLTYYWTSRIVLIAMPLQLLFYYYLLPPAGTLKEPTPTVITQVITLVAAMLFTIAIVRLARQRRTIAEQSVQNLVALNRIGTALLGELDETRLLHFIAETACNLTGAEVAAFTLRPVDEQGNPSVPAKGNLFHLAAVVGVTEEQMHLFHKTPLGGEGLLAPIFQQGAPVLITDILPYMAADAPPGGNPSATSGLSEQGRHRPPPEEEHHAARMPEGHPDIRSFLGAPILDHARQIQGGLLLGHAKPGRFTTEHQTLLVALAAQAAIVLENARLYRTMQMRAQELNAIFESITDGIILVDAQETILRENAAAQHLREILAARPDGAQTLQELLYRPVQRVMQGEHAKDIPVEIRDGKQERQAYIVNVAPLRLPTASPDTAPQGKNYLLRTRKLVSGAVVIWHNVTETRHLLAERRARAEAEARHTLLQTVLDELPISVYLVRGKEAQLVLANHTAKTIWGATWAQGQSIQEFLQKHAIHILGTDGQELCTEQLATWRAVQLGETIYQHQETIRHADGTTLPVLVNAVALDTHKLQLTSNSAKNNGPEPAAIVVHQDVTLLKQAEQIKDDFIGIAAHELRTPLAILKGFAQMLLVQSTRGKGPELVDWQIEALQGIDQATARLVELTEDLLDVTRLQAGRMNLQLEPIELIALTKRVVTRLQMTTNRHTLSIHTEAEYLVVEADKQRLEQVLSNIISNALKYSPDGGPIEIVLRDTTKPRNAILSVRDHGIGIPEQQKAQIFNRFVRADNVRAYGIGGTGLGLYLCRELIERQRGHIWFESVEGRGTTFFFDLPLIDLDNTQ